MINYLFITFFVILADQFSKFYIKSSFQENITTNILGSFLRFNYINNPGIVFGIQVDSIFYYIVILLSLLIIIYISFLMKGMIHQNSNNSFGLISLALILGGAIGNIIDRLFVVFRLFDYSGVVDFISIGFGEYYRFPYIFNIADASVTIGILVFIYYNYTQGRKLNNARAEEI